MKKFLGKKPVMITFLSVAVVLLVVYIGMLVRPVAIGFSYKGEVSGTEYSVKIKNGSEAVMSIEGVEETQKCRYVVKGREIFVIPEEMTDEEYKEAKKEILDNWDMVKVSPFFSKTNAFKVEMMNEEFTCAGSIVLAVVGGIVTAAVITFATLSTIVVVKKKKA